MSVIARNQSMTNGRTDKPKFEKAGHNKKSYYYNYYLKQKEKKQQREVIFTNLVINYYLPFINNIQNYNKFLK